MNESRQFDPWRITSLVLLILGLIFVALSFIDRTPGFGAIQVLQLLLGIAALTLAIFMYLYTLRSPDEPRSLQADIGIRLALSGLVFCFVAGFSDLIGIGTHVNPRFERPFIGFLQLIGLAIGGITILAGIVLYYTSRGQRQSSSLEFLIPDKEDGN
ncbi:MAG: hypothetical protein KDE09_19000 [Anaerolineales bacterium]|nr:hypothetical protein [Anaerolineales bacterium]MCB0012992.1 hypothetical protein [Anaerolineales bacterium]MCB0019890.1 hypothetical protein [Anaerolineales bacterium]MCB8962811.1 hypothetical protein [Ardenticatenales bacterium]